MAIEQNDRENLLRDAVMMPIRGETQIDGHTIVVGFRSAGRLSLYCDADPVFQFNADKELRRVYFQGERYSAENGMLVKLTRDTQGGKVVFCREDVPPQIVVEIKTTLANWVHKLEQTSMSAWTSADEHAKFTEGLSQWLRDRDTTIAIADNPTA